MLYSGEKTTGYASGASGGSTPVAFPWWRLPPYHGGAEGRLRRPRRAGAMDKDSLSHTIRYCACHVVWIPRRRRKAPCGETEREVGEMPGMLAGAGMVGGAPAPTTHASALGLRPSAARATWWVGRGVRARSYRASGTMSGGPLRAGTGRCGRGATTRAPSAPASRSSGGTSSGSLTGASQGSGNAPDGGLTAAATGPSRQCRCRDEPLWGVTKAPGYAGGSLFDIVRTLFRNFSLHLPHTASAN